MEFKFTPNLALLMIVHAVKSPEFLKIAGDKLEERDFDGAMEYAPRVLWSFIQAYWKHHHKCIPLTILQLKLEQFIIDEQLDETKAASLWEIFDITRLYEDKDLAPADLLDQFKEFILKRRLPTHADKLQYGNADEIYTTMQNIARDVSISTDTAVDLTGLDVIDIFDNPPRMPTGVAPIDTLLQGGVLPGELYGFLAPSGGGKSTTAYTLVSSMARAKKNVAYFVYEEGGNSILQRIHISNTGLNRSLVENRKASSFGDNIVQQLRDSMLRLNPYIHYFDKTKPGCGSGGADEIYKNVRDAYDRGVKLDLICIDWLGQMTLKFMGANAVDGDMRKTMGMMNSGLLQIAQDFKVPIFVFHQLAKDKCGKAPGKIPHYTDSQDAKNFADLFSYVFVLGNMQREKIESGAEEIGAAWLNLSKARGLPEDKMIIEIAGSRCRIRTPKYNWGTNEFKDRFEFSEDNAKTEDKLW